MARLPLTFLLVSILGFIAGEAAAVEVGLKAGVNFSRLQGGVLAESADVQAPFPARSWHRSAAKTRTGVVFGATVTAHAAADLELRADMLYVQKGAAFDGYVHDMLYDTAWSATMKLDYLELPVYLRLHHALHASTQLYFEAGFYGAVLLDARTASGGQVVEGLWDDVSGGDFGGVLGAGVLARIGDRRCTLGIRYEPGLREIQTSGDSGRNTSLAVSATMAF